MPNSRIEGLKTAAAEFGFPYFLPDRSDALVTELSLIKQLKWLVGLHLTLLSEEVAIILAETQMS